MPYPLRASLHERLGLPKPLRLLGGPCHPYPTLERPDPAGLCRRQATHGHKISHQDFLVQTDRMHPERNDALCQSPSERKRGWQLQPCMVQVKLGGKQRRPVKGRLVFLSAFSILDRIQQFAKPSGLAIARCPSTDRSSALFFGEGLSHDINFHLVRELP